MRRPARRVLRGLSRVCNRARGAALRLAFTVALIATVLPAAADEARSIDVKASRATFAVQHVLIERVTGSVPIVAGNVTLAADGETPVAVDATLDARHADTGDSDRDGDLQGPDWFDTKLFPVWTFKSTQIATTKPGSYAISGLFTLHGVGVPVTLVTTLVRGGPHPLYHATATVDRHAFGMTVTRTDVLVGNTVTIVLDVQLA